MLYTLGYGNRSIDYIKKMISSYQIEILIDIREIPYSKFNPTMNREALKENVTGMNCKYLWKGNELGGKTVVITDESLAWLVDVSKSKSVVIMCAELDYHKCHRHYEIARRLLDTFNLSVGHIIEEGHFDWSVKTEPVCKQENLF